MPTTSNFGWTTPADTDLVKDGAAAIRTLGNGVDSSFVDLKGGTSGQILAKNSGTDLDFVWIANDQGDITEVQAGTGISVASGTGPIPVVTNTVATAFDAKGDLIGGTGADTFARLAVGTNNTVLTADSSTATGLKWAAPASTEAPAFWAYKAGPDQSLTSGTYTKVTFANETLDSNSWYDTSNSRFTPQTAGYYWITGSVRFENTSTTTELRLMIYKNGSAVNIQTTLGSAGTIWNGLQISSLVYFNGSTDYVELYASQNFGSNKVIFYTQNEAWFQGYRVRT